MHLTYLKCAWPDIELAKNVTAKAGERERERERDLIQRLEDKTMLVQLGNKITRQGGARIRFIKFFIPRRYALCHIGIKNLVVTSLQCSQMPSWLLPNDVFIGERVRVRVFYF